jgi:REP element-mobilizing transposase RayT
MSGLQRHKAVRQRSSMPSDDSQKPYRRPQLRLPHYDYGSGGAYFVTICLEQRECLLGQVANGEIHLNECGVVVRDEWMRSGALRPEMELDDLVVMPNHLHGIVWITEQAEAHCRVPLQAEGSRRRPRTLSSFIAQYKAYSTKRINELRGTPGARLWQPNFYEHVIRNDEDLYNVRKYIQENPLKWELDKENPANLRNL